MSVKFREKYKMSDPDAKKIPRKEVIPRACKYCEALAVDQQTENAGGKLELITITFKCCTRALLKTKGAQFLPGWQVKCRKLG